MPEEENVVEEITWEEWSEQLSQELEDSDVCADSCCGVNAYRDYYKSKMTPQETALDIIEKDQKRKKKNKNE